jgi:hypothetical protein
MNSDRNTSEQCGKTTEDNNLQGNQMKDVGLFSTKDADESLDLTDDVKQSDIAAVVVGGYDANA